MTDTATAQPAQAIVVQVNGVADGVGVEFETDPRGGNEGTLVSDIATADFSNHYVAMTDARGKAAARVSLGRIAGPTYVRISVPSLDVIDSVPITIRPGALSGIAADPSHSTILLGGNRAIGVLTADRHGNPRTGDTISLRPIEDFVTTTGTTVHGAKTGLSTVQVYANSV